MTPLFKKEHELSKKNYLTVSALSHAPMIFDRIVINQMNQFLEPKFSPLLTGFYKNYSTQKSLLNMTRKWKHALEKG